MKKISLISLIFASLSFGLSAQAQSKIGFVDADSVLRALPEAKQKQEELKAYGEQLQAALSEKQKTFETKYNEYTKNGPNLPPLLRQDKEKELQQLSADIQEFEQKAQQDLSQQESVLMQPILTKVQAAIKTVAKANTYAYIVPKSVLLYGEDKHDITQLVIKKLMAK